MTADRDPVVGALLDRLPVHPPPPAFWDDLRARLEAEGGAPVVELRPPVQGPASRRRLIIALGAAAAILVAVVVGSALRDGRDDLDTRPPVSQPNPPTTATTAPATTPEAAVLQAASRWIDAAAGGDADAAWALLGPQSRDSVGGRAAFDELMASTLPATWATWASAGPEAATALNMGSAAEPRWWIVAFEPVETEGRITPPEDDPLRGVLAVRLGADLDDISVEPFLPGPALSLIELPMITQESDGPFPLVDPEGPITVHVDADAGHFVVAIDGVAATEDELERNGLGHVLAVRPSRPMASGRTHTITVGVVLADGTIAADSRGFRVR